MFESAIEAAGTAASGWTPERGDPGGGRQCCPLCLHRYRQLVLNGPLRQLPHAVAHAAVVVVDDIICERVDAALERIEWESFSSLAPQEDRDRDLVQRARAATGALRVVAMEEFAAAEERLAGLRHDFTDPALDAYLGRHRMNEVPWQWEL